MSIQLSEPLSINPPPPPSLATLPAPPRLQRLQEPSHERTWATLSRLIMTIAIVLIANSTSFYGQNTLYSSFLPICSSCTALGISILTPFLLDEESGELSNLARMACGLVILWASAYSGSVLFEKEKYAMAGTVWGLGETVGASLALRPKVERARDFITTCLYDVATATPNDPEAPD